MNALSPAATRTGRLQGLIVPPGVFRLILAGGVLLSHVTRVDIYRLAPE